MSEHALMVVSLLSHKTSRLELWKNYHAFEELDVTLRAFYKSRIEVIFGKCLVTVTYHGELKKKVKVHVIWCLLAFCIKRHWLRRTSLHLSPLELLNKNNGSVG